MDELELGDAIREQTAWLRVLALPQVRANIDEILDTDQKRRAYEASDGIRSTREVASIAGSSSMSVSRWWAHWRAGGIGVGVAGGRTRHIVSLQELGLRDM
jgi:hypothetical protein